MVIPYFGKHRFYHIDLLDMPSASNDDHDGRYLLLTGGIISGSLTLNGGLTMGSHIYMDNGQRIYWDTNDYVGYNRAMNTWLLVIGGIGQVLMDTGGVYAPRFHSNIAIGTSPFTVVSTTKCINLNADKLDGYDAGNASGNVPISNGTKCTNLHADIVDNFHLLQFYSSPANMNSASSRTYTLTGLTSSDRICANIIAEITGIKIDIEWWLSQFDGSAVRMHVVNASGSSVDVGLEAMAFRPA